MWKNTQPIHIMRKLILTVLFACCFIFSGCAGKNTSKEESADIEKIQAEILRENEMIAKNEAENSFVPVFSKSDIPDDVRDKMYGVTISGSSRVDFDGLSYLTVTHIGYDGENHTGNLIVDKSLADEVLNIFEELYTEKFPVKQIKPAYEYGGDDELSMEDDNTSSFNDRPVTGGTGLSYHQLGRAIDINPLVNPYIKGNVVLPETAQTYTDRTLDEKGMITADGVCVRIFKKYGWTWGGDWKSLKDYQHFEKR